MYITGVPGVLVVHFRCTVLDYMEYWWYRTGVHNWSTWSTGGKLQVYSTGVPPVLVIQYRCKVLKYLEYWWYSTGVHYWSPLSTGGTLHMYSRGRYVFWQLNILRTTIWLHLVFSAYHI